MRTPSLTKYRRIILLTDGFSTPFLAKTAISLLRYRGDDIAAVLDSEHVGRRAKELLGYGDDVPVIDAVDAVQADALFVGIAPPGGQFPAHWKPIVLQAIQQGLDIVSGLHDFLIHDESFTTAAAQHGVQLIDVRRNNENQTAQVVEFRRECLRIHAVGNDCSLGKMVTTLELQRALTDRGCDAGFAATGQTGIMVSGSGIPIDCVIADFINGAAERLVIQHQQHDYLLIEGQGSISHPAYSAVTNGLLHGCAPDGLIFCYEAGRENMKGFDHVAMAPMRKIFDAYHMMANLRHPCKIVGIAANTRHLNHQDAIDDMQAKEAEFGVPVADVYRFGCDRLVDAVVQLRSEVVG